MKDYKKTFNDNNKTIIEQHNNAGIALDNKIGNKKIMVAIVCTLLWLGFVFMALYISAGWTFLGFKCSVLMLDDSDGHIRWFLVIVVTFVESLLIGIILFVTYFFIALSISHKENNEDKVTEQLQDKAIFLAATIYLDDIIAALSSRFTLSDEFKNKFQAIIMKYDWLENGEFDAHGIDFDYLEDEQQLIIKDGGFTYYLTNFLYYDNAPFRFFLEKIHPDGFVEDIEYALPQMR
jgi:hypothetical protein